MCILWKVKGDPKLGCMNHHVFLNAHPKTRVEQIHVLEKWRWSVQVSSCSFVFSAVLPCTNACISFLQSATRSLRSLSCRRCPTMFSRSDSFSNLFSRQEMIRWMESLSVKISCWISKVCIFPSAIYMPLAKIIYLWIFCFQLTRWLSLAPLLLLVYPPSWNYCRTSG